MSLKKIKSGKNEVLNESKIQQKLYGYLAGNKEAEKEPGKIPAPAEKKPPQKEQLSENTQNKIKKIEEELAAAKQKLAPVQQQYAPSVLKNKIIPEKKELSFNPSVYFRALNLKAVLVLMAVILSLFLLFSKKKPAATSASAAVPATAPLKTIPINTASARTQTEPDISAHEPLYTIQVCIYEKEQDAQRLAEELKKKKFDAYIYNDQSKSRTKYRVYVGEFSSKQKAMATLNELTGSFKDSFVRLVNK